MNHVLVLQNATSHLPVPSEADLNRWMNAALQDTYSNFEVTVRLVDEAESRELNHQYRDRDSATNVLSFPAEVPGHIKSDLESAGTAMPLGDLVICAPVVSREAGEQGKTEAAHWAHLLIHGVLHLLGHRHDESSEAAAMEQLERKLLAGLGISDPYLLD
jgi:probable rRNA maturation factor